jgi:hypothetical protein
MAVDTQRDHAAGFAADDSEIAVLAPEKTSACLGLSRVFSCQRLLADVCQGRDKPIFCAGTASGDQAVKRDDFQSRLRRCDRLGPRSPVRKLSSGCSSIVYNFFSKTCDAYALCLPELCSVPLQFSLVPILDTLIDTGAIWCARTAKTFEIRLAREWIASSTLVSPGKRDRKSRDRIGLPSQRQHQPQPPFNLA